MVTEERPDQEEEGVQVAPTEPQDMVAPEAAKTDELVPPKGISDIDDKQMQTKALALVKQLEESTGSQELETIDSIGSVGIQAQRNAGTELDLLRTRMGDMMSQEGPGGDIAKDMTNLRLALNQISPHELSQKTGISKILSAIPFVGKITPRLKVLEKIAIRYEPVSRQVEEIETKLREGRAMLTRDNIELRKLYEQVESQQLPIQKNAYLGELIMQELTGVMERTDDTLRIERVRNVLHDVSMRVQDLRTMETVHTQFFTSIEMTRQNNTRLGQSVERTLALGSNVVMVGLAIQSALTRQKRVQEATMRTREFLGNLIAANAASIKQHTADIGDIYNNPVIAIDKIEQAHNDLIEAMDMADRLKQEGIDSARENIAKLRELSTAMQERSQGLREQRETEPRSIEA